jgi:hypothetical protein
MKFIKVVLLFVALTIMQSCNQDASMTGVDMDILHITRDADSVSTVKVDSTEVDTLNKQNKH